MPSLVAIVEGHGDVAAIPTVIGKIGGWLEEPLFVANPIRAGSWGAIKKAGGLEKLVRLAASRPECTKVVVLTDLDDGCPVTERAEVEARRAELVSELNILIEICFCIREFEAWILSSLDQIAARLDDLTNVSTEVSLEDNSAFRDAKGRLRRLLPDGYSESADQGRLVRGLDPSVLYARDRSFRRFVKAISGYDYADIQVEAAAEAPNTN